MSESRERSGRRRSKSGSKSGSGSGKRRKVRGASTTFHPLRDLAEHWAVWLGLGVALAVWCWVDVMNRARIDPAHPELHMTDVTVYTQAALALSEGRDAYDPEVQNIRGWKYLYPPLFAILISPIARLPPEWQAAAWFWISVLLAWGCYVEMRWLLDLMRKARDKEEDPIPESWFLWLGLATAAWPLLNCLQRGQVGVFLLYPLLAGLRLVLDDDSRERWFWGGVLLMLPVVIKLTPALPVATLWFLLAVQGFGRGHLIPRLQFTSLGLLGGSLLFVLLLPGVLLGWQRNLDLLGHFQRNVLTKVDDVRTEDFGEKVTSKRNQSLANATYRLGNFLAARVGLGPDDLLVEKSPAEIAEVLANSAQPEAKTPPGGPGQAAEPPRLRMPMDSEVIDWALRIVRGLAVVVCLLLAGTCAVRRNRLAVLACFGLAMVATFVVSPVARGHYFVLWLPAVVWVPLWLSRHQQPQLARWVAIVPAVLVSLHYVLLDFTGRIGLLGLGCTAWFFYAGWKFFLSTLKAAFFETGDSPKVRAVFVDGTLPDEAEEGQGEGGAGQVVAADGDSDDTPHDRAATVRDSADQAPRDTQPADPSPLEMPPPQPGQRSDP
ncbi:MAG: glycosyltransferase family 87 protein, partial [Planctomycetaceae bacterium]